MASEPTVSPLYSRGGHSLAYAGKITLPSNNTSGPELTITQDKDTTPSAKFNISTIDLKSLFVDNNQITLTAPAVLVDGIYYNPVLTFNGSPK